MEIERAQQIVNMMFSLHMIFDVGLEPERMEVTDVQSLVRELAAVSLQDMVTANEMVRKYDLEKPAAPDGTRTMQMVCADRLIAAYYVALNYDPQDAGGDDNVTPIVTTNDRALVLVKYTPPVSSEDDDEAEDDPR